MKMNILKLFLAGLQAIIFVGASIGKPKEEDEAANTLKIEIKIREVRMVKRRFR